MAKITEWSDDGTNWFPLKNITTLTPALIRETNNLAGKKIEELRGIVTEVLSKKRSKRPNDIHRIEYSMDSGYSWQEYAIKDSDSVSPYAANLYRLANTTTGYSVRTLNVIDNRVSYEESTKRFQDFTKTDPKIKSDEVFIWRRDGKYDWGSSILDGHDSWEYISRLHLTIPFRMTAPNSNKIIWTKWTEACTEWEFDKIPEDESVKAANMGHVYRLSESPGPSSEMSTLLSSNTAHVLKFNYKEWSQLECARLYDEESETILGKFDKIAVLGGKYVVGNSQKYKLGNRFFVRNSDVFSIIAAINSIGGYISIPMTEKVHQMGIENDNLTARAYIHVLEDLLKKASTPEEIADAVANAIEYRDKSVDAIKQLNSTIISARERLQEVLSEASSQNEVNSGRS